MFRGIFVFVLSVFIFGGGLGGRFFLARLNIKNSMRKLSYFLIIFTLVITGVYEVPQQFLKIFGGGLRLARLNF